MKTYRVRYGTSWNYNTVYFKAESLEKAREDAILAFGKDNIVEIREW